MGPGACATLDYPAPGGARCSLRALPPSSVGNIGEGRGAGNQAGRRALGPGRSAAATPGIPHASSSRRLLPALPSAPLARSRSAPGKAHTRAPARRGRPGPDLPSADAGPRPGGAAQTAWEPEPAAAAVPAGEAVLRARRGAATPPGPARRPRSPRSARRRGSVWSPGGRGRRAAPGSPGRVGEATGGPTLFRWNTGEEAAKGRPRRRCPEPLFQSGVRATRRLRGGPAPAPSAVPWWGGDKDEDPGCRRGFRGSGCGPDADPLEIPAPPASKPSAQEDSEPPGCSSRLGWAESQSQPVLTLLAGPRSWPSP